MVMTRGDQQQSGGQQDVAREMLDGEDAKRNGDE
jgi:hypothetical protein